MKIFDGCINTFRGHSLHLYNFEIYCINTIIISLSFFRILLIALASCYLHISLLLAKNYLRTWCYLHICNLLRCANKECAWSYQNAKNGILNGLFPPYYDIFRNSKNVARVYIHPSKFNFSSVFPFNWHEGMR